jgi:hypothetical protein
MENAFTALIQALSARVGTTLEITDDGTVHVDFDATPLLIKHLADAEQILLAAPVAEVPAAGREGLYRALLQGQYIFAGTRGATLALDAEERFVCLQMAPSLHALTLENFPVLVENFLNMADHWRARCQEATEGETGSGEAASAPEAGMLRI